MKALGVLLRFPGRSLLTITGLAIGVGAFIAMLSFGEGARRSVLSQFEALGVNLLKVSSVSGQRAGGRATQPLTAADVTAMRRDAPAVAQVIPVARRNLELTHGANHHFSTVYGTLPRFIGAHDWQLADGGNFDDVDEAGRARVCVLGHTPASALFGSADPLGVTVTLGAVTTCRVIGVLAPKGHSTSGSDLDDLVLMPLSAYNTTFGATGYSYLELEPSAPDQLDAARDEAVTLLRQTHAIQPGDFDDFSVSSPREVVLAADRISRILVRLLRAIAAVSLLVGGIGIMNIQLVSVAERTREIGIRSAIGASPGQILRLFLGEAIVLSLLGAAVGVALGWAVSALVATGMGWPRVLSARQIAAGAAFGIGVGVLFGFLPARRAAHLDPIEALRRE